MSNNILISVTAQDQVGIIANVTKTIEQLGGDLTDLSQTVLDGYFTMILAAVFPENICPVKLNKVLKENFLNLDSEKNFEILTWKIDKTNSTVKSTNKNNIYILTVKAKNRKGLVAEISSFCSDNNLNIINLCSEAKNNNYTMIFFIELEDSIIIKDIRNKLDKLAENLNLKIMLQHQDIFRSTNEIYT